MKPSICTDLHSYIDAPDTLLELKGVEIIRYHRMVFAKLLES